MWITRTKYNSDTIWVVCNNEEGKVIDAYNKELWSLPIWVQEELGLWLSHCIEKYWLEYMDCIDKSKYLVGKMILDKCPSKVSAQ